MATIQFFQSYSKEIVSLLVPIVGALLTYFLRPRAKIIWSVTSSMTLQTEEPQIGPDGKAVVDETGKPVLSRAIVRTKSLFFKNVGREAAVDVEIVFNWRPPHFNMWPQRHYEVSINPENRFVIQIKNLAAKEFIGVETLSVNTV